MWSEEWALHDNRTEVLEKEVSEEWRNWQTEAMYVVLGKPQKKLFFFRGPANNALLPPPSSVWPSELFLGQK